MLFHRHAKILALFLNAVLQRLVGLRGIHGVESEDELSLAELHMEAIAITRFLRHEATTL